MERKEPTPATLKALFAKSGNRCAFSRCQNSLVDDLNIFVGEVCHIHSVNKKDARYDATKSEDELRDFENLILMCHAHHKRVDTREDLYSAETLQNMKAAHESIYDHDAFAIDDSVLAQATLQIIQEDWEPYLDSATDYLYATLDEGHISQSRMNRVSGNVAEITDAQLFIVYTRLFQTLSPADQVDLYRDQQAWRERRTAYAESQVESHGGSLAPLEYSGAFTDFTKQRIEELSKRIQKE